MELVRTNFTALDSDQRWGLLTVWAIAEIASVCLGSACVGEASRLMGAGVGGVVGFLAASLVVILLLSLASPAPRGRRADIDEGKLS